jgi:hypothetical protein
MSFYSDASLVMIPSGYKNQKVYCAVPTDGLGDLTFSRASSATRVASNGLIEKVRTNQLLQSNNFSNAYWTKVNATITAGQSDPNGGTSAFKIDFASGANAYLGVFGLGTGLKTNSVFLRADSSVQIGFGNGQISNAVTLTTSWVRYQIAQTGILVGAGFQLDNYFGVTTPQLGITIYAFQAQLEDGDIATDYIPTTTAAVSVGPVSGLPRLDYLGSTCPRLLLEPQRTNLVTFSEQFNNAAWAKTNASVTANAVTSPTGYQDADTLTADGASGTHRATAVLALGAGKTLSVFAKAGTNNFIQFYTDSTNNDFANFDLVNGVVGTKGPDATSSIEDYGNGWYRCIMTTGNAASQNFAINIVSSASAGRAQTTTLTTSVHLFGAQIETGAYATSYIPTLGAAVTRVAEVAILNNSAALPTAYPFTLFADFEVTSASEGQAITLSNSASSSEYFTIEYSGGLYRAISRPSSTTNSVVSTTTTTLGFHKACAVFTSTTIKLYVDGVLAASGSNAQAFNALINDLFVGQLRSVTDTGNRNSVKQALVFNSALTDQQAIELTA